MQHTPDKSSGACEASGAEVALDTRDGGVLEDDDEVGALAAVRRW